jgi:hypothetical protein
VSMVVWASAVVGTASTSAPTSAPMIVLRMSLLFRFQVPQPEGERCSKQT